MNHATGCEGVATAGRTVPCLRRGDRVAIAAPAGWVSPEPFTAALPVMRRLGLRPVYREDIFDRHLYFARPDRVRAAELAEYLLDPAIRAVFCACPGYGSLRLLPLLPWDAIAATPPKPVLGYSDITALLLALYARAGWATIHGPTVLPGFVPGGVSPMTRRALRRMLFRTGPLPRLRLAPAEVLAEGAATGPLVGGNLELLTSLLGTPWAPPTRGAILFIEEVGESEEVLDERLAHLRLAGKLDGVRAVLFGDMSLNPISTPYHILDVIREAVGDLGVPIACGLPAGHGTHNVPLAIGATYTLDTRRRTVEQLDFGSEETGDVPALV